MHITSILSESLRKARSAPLTTATKQQLHAQRSISWLRELAAGFRAAYGAEADVRVLWKYGKTNKVEFGLNELLYDVCVCRVGSCQSATGRKRLCFVREALWLVESEFSRDSQQAIFDFNKLDSAAPDRRE